MTELYRCSSCDYEFSVPEIDTGDNLLDYGGYTYMCPNCHSPSYVEIHRCNQCGKEEQVMEVIDGQPYCWECAKEGEEANASVHPTLRNIINKWFNPQGDVK